MDIEPAALLIGLREGLEALLIVGILLGFLVRLGHADRRHLVWIGAGAGLVASIALGLLLRSLVAGFEGSGGAEAFEIVAALVAIAILSYMVVWMYRHTQQILGTLKAKVTTAATDGRWLVIGTLAFVTVLREGVETVLFYATLANRVGWDTLLLSGLVGFGLSAAIAFALFRLTVKVDLKRFFALTGFLLIFIAAGLVVHVVHASAELGILPHQEPLWDSSAALPDDGHWLGSPLHAFIGYEDQPTILQLFLYLAYLVGVGGAYALGLARRSEGRRTRQAAAGGVALLLVAAAVVSAAFATAGAHDEPAPEAPSQGDATADALSRAQAALLAREGRVGILLRDHGEIVSYNATTYESIKEFIVHIWPYTGLPAELLAVDDGTYLIDGTHPFDETARTDARLVDAWLAPWGLPAVPVTDPAGATAAAGYDLGGHYYFVPGAGPGWGEGDLFEIFGLAAYRDWLKMDNWSPRHSEGHVSWDWLSGAVTAAFGERVVVAFAHGHDPRLDPSETLAGAARRLVDAGVDVVLDAYQSSIHSDSMNTCMMAPHAEHALRAAGFRGDVVRVAAQAGHAEAWGRAVADFTESLVAEVGPGVAVSIHLAQHGGTPGSPNPCGTGADRYHANAARQFDLASAAVAERLAARGNLTIRHEYGQGAGAADDGVLSPREALDLDAAHGIRQVFIVPYEFWGNALDNLVYLRESLGFEPEDAPYYDAGYETHLTWKGMAVSVTSSFFSTETKAEAQLQVLASAIAEL